MALLSPSVKAHIQMRTIQYTQLIWASMLIIAFGVFLIWGGPTFNRIYYFSISLIYGAAAIIAFKNYKLAWICSIVFTLYIFVFHGLNLLPGLLPTEDNLRAHSESPMGTVILTMYSLLFLVPPAILFCY